MNDVDWLEEEMNEKRVCVLIVDSHVSSSEMLSIVLGRESRYSLADEAKSGSDGLRLFRKYKPQLVISGLEMPEMNGAEMLHQMREENPEIRILIYTGTENRNLIYAGLEMQPQGFVHKSENLELLLQAINLIAHKGGTYISPYATQLIIQKRSESQIEAKLTPQERTILQLIAEGLSSKQVANKLNLSPKTVEHYRKHVMQKLNLNCVASLTRYAVRYGLVNAALCVMTVGMDMDFDFM